MTFEEEFPSLNKISTKYEKQCRVYLKEDIKETCIDKQKVRDAINKVMIPYTEIREEQINEIMDGFNIKKIEAKNYLIYIRKMEEFERKRTCLDLLKELNLGDEYGNV